MRLQASIQLLNIQSRIMLSAYDDNTISLLGNVIVFCAEDRILQIPWCTYIITYCLKSFEDSHTNGNVTWTSAQQSGNIFKNKDLWPVMINYFYKALEKIVSIIILHRIRILCSTSN